MSLLSDKMESRLSLDRAGGGGSGEREGDPDSPRNRGKGWEGVCREKRLASGRTKVSASFHGRGNRQWAALRARAGLGFPEPRGFVLRPDTGLYHGKPHFTSPQLTLGATLGATKPSSGCPQPPPSITEPFDNGRVCLFARSVMRNLLQ